jgi:high-affinity Fe2+/Pb2+ permease
MRTDQYAYQQATRIAGLGLILQLAIGLVLFVVGSAVGSTAFVQGSTIAFVGVAVWAVLIVIFHQHRLAAIEAKEKAVNDKRAEGTALRGTKPAEGFVMAAVEVKGRVPETKLFHRGDHEQPKQTVSPGELSVLAVSGPPGAGIEPLIPAETQAGSSGRRLA